MARPRIPIDKQTFEKLCGLQCTEQEIADWFNCSPDTIERFCKRTYKMRFAEVFNQKRSIGKISLRRMQWKLAEKSAPMAIKKKKNYLGQTDERKQQVELTAQEREQTKLDGILAQIISDDDDEEENEE